MHSVSNMKLVKKNTNFLEKSFVGMIIIMALSKFYYFKGKSSKRYEYDNLC